MQVENNIKIKLLCSKQTRPSLPKADDWIGMIKPFIKLKFPVGKTLYTVNKVWLIK